jgi:glycine/D-amino acid oxidase-like deaminating enzyme
VEGDFYAICRTPGTLLLGMPPLVDGIAAESFSREPVAAQRAAYLALLRRRVPALAEARDAGGWAGLLVSSPDGAPLLGEHPAIAGLHVATGFAGGGLQRVTAAEAVAQAMLGEEPFCDLTDYHVRRFAGYDGSDFEFADGLPYYYSDAASGATTTSVGEPSR